MRLAALHGEEWSLVLEIDKGGAPLWRHLGARVETVAMAPLRDTRGSTTFSLERDQPLSLVPTRGLGWFGEEALACRDASGMALPVHFDAFEVEEADDALAFTLSDSVCGLALDVRFADLAGGLVIEIRVSNSGEAPILLDRLASLAIPLPSTSAEILSWRGRHNAEFAECREPMPSQGWHRESRLGITGHGGPPGCYVLGEGAGWDAGEVLAVQFGWSGDTRLGIEPDDEGGYVLMGEALLAPGEIRLEPGESFAAPPAYVAISNHGRNGAMAFQHAMMRSLIAWPGGAMLPRPVHLNSWEACYFAHDEERIARLAKAAADLGAERFILDDGWFRGRNWDNAGLGDWTPDPKKYPRGLRPLAERVQALGLEFGLWVEPEMVNPDSDLYRAHPDWVLALEGRDRPTARNQLVLDLRREEVREYLFNCLDALLREVPISYLKWDHNRPHAPSGGAEQVRGAYALFERLRAAHPAVEIESCSAGGGRIDAGILRHTHRFWTSDNIDALSRLDMQRGFLAFMPPEVMGAHVGASPSHATGRTQTLDFRAAIAAQGHFGVELDPEAMAEKDRARLAEWLDFAKRWRGLVHGGKTLVGEGVDGLAWQAQGSGDEYLLWVIRKSHPAQRRSPPLRLPFAEDRDWSVRLLETTGSRHVLAAGDGAALKAMREEPATVSGSWLANAGLALPAIPAEGAAIFHLKAMA
ncbi:alpha-galactosidase [Qipengyuania flava]|uniref:alpha-galactosidase n=1 Tax=Qipengyuania flava TaxID=192812 RepID=UPI001C6261FB|nr:alpha-galactosidase [Qipengyuania flava]QYJ07763.1 alpha-galactosidase [Qipengyuania flava]